MDPFLVAMGIITLLLMTQRWFWITAFGVGGLAAAFTTLAAIIHFQIGTALLAFGTMAILWFICAVIIVKGEEERWFAQQRANNARRRAKEEGQLL